MKSHSPTPIARALGYVLVFLLFSYVSWLGFNIHWLYFTLILPTMLFGLSLGLP